MSTLSEKKLLVRFLVLTSKWMKSAKLVLRCPQDLESAKRYAKRLNILLGGRFKSWIKLSRTISALKMISGRVRSS